jgi:hypothetical protein
MIPKKRLWLRELSCGHARATEIAYICGNYKKPKVNNTCYCRTCHENATITHVEELGKKAKEELEK